MLCFCQCVTDDEDVECHLLLCRDAGPVLYSEELHGEVQGGPARDHLIGDLVGIVFLHV